MLLQFAGDVEHGAGTDHHGRFGAVHGLHFMETSVAGQGGQHPQAQFIEQRQGVPELARNVVFADQVDIVDTQMGAGGIDRGRVRLAGADHVLDHRFASQPIAEIFVAVKAGGVHRNHRYVPALGRRFAHGFQIVADQRCDAGAVNEHRRWGIAVDGLFDSVKQPFLAAPHDHVLLTQIGGHADLKQGRTAGASAAIIPGAAGATARAMHDVGDIGDRQQGDLRTVEGAATSGGTGRGPRATGFAF